MYNLKVNTMKKYFLILGMATFVSAAIVSCGSKSNSNDESDVFIIENEETSTSTDNYADEQSAVSNSSTDSDEEMDLKSEKSSENWDRVLDDYESYVDSYLKTYKKAMNGDASAMNEYVDLLEKAESFSRKLEKADNDLTPAQMKRYEKITMKMANVY